MEERIGLAEIFGDMMGLAGIVQGDVKAAVDQNQTTDASIATRLDVADLVAHHDGCTQVDVVSRTGFEKHPRFGFATGTHNPEDGDGPVLVVGAVEHIGQRNAGFDKAGSHPLVEDVIVFFGVVSPGNTRLVGDNDQGIPRFGEHAAGLKHSWYKNKVFDFMKIINFLVDNPVAVEKQGGSGSSGHGVGLSLIQRCRGG